MAKKSPTFEQRLASAQAGASAATSVFAAVIADLENAATDKEQLVLDIFAEIARLEQLVGELGELAAEATESAGSARNQADAIRGLFAA